MMPIFFLAIAAGFLTILAPCILPVLPILLGTSGGKSRWKPFLTIIGFVGSFSILGAAFATAGNFLGISNAVARDVAVVLLLLFGFALLFEGIYDRAMIRLQPILAGWSAKISGGAIFRTDALSGLLVGVSLGLVWTPCAGPILGTILTIATRSNDYTTTLLLMIAYSLGAGIPMGLIAYGGQKFQKKLLTFGAWHSIVQKFFGALVIAMAIAIFTGYDTHIITSLIHLYPSNFTSKL